MVIIVIFDRNRNGSLRFPCASLRRRATLAAFFSPCLVWPDVPTARVFKNGDELVIYTPPASRGAVGARPKVKKLILAIVLQFWPIWLYSQTYSTSFPLTENPISERSKWVGGQSAGGNLWGDIQVSGGMAYGVGEPTLFGDPTAILTGPWAA